MNLKRVAIRWITSLALIATALPVSAEVTSSDDGWRYGAELYLWGAAIGAKTAGGTNVDVSFSDLVSNLNFALMGAFLAQKGRWSVLADLMYMDVETGMDARPFSSPQLTNVQMKARVATPAVGYTLMESPTSRLDVLAGARYLWVNPDLQLQVAPILLPIKVNVSSSASAWNGIVGLRGSFDLSPRWYATYYADIGTGDSKSTWQAVAGVGYRFKTFDAHLGYRYLEWKFSDNAPLDDMHLSGPFLGARMHF